VDLDLFTFNIVGFPMEGEREMRDTFRLNRKAKPDGGVCTFFYPYRHTRLYEICEEKGVLLGEEELTNITNYNTRPSIRMSPDLMKACVEYQRIITDYLEHRRLLWRIRHQSGLLPDVLKRFVSPAWYASFLGRNPALYKCVKKLYGVSGWKWMVHRKS
jgi:radical SAM superfamily enzyme YgiQ (UPF0313 family)